MDLIKPILPTIRVWIFGGVVWLLAKAGLPGEHAEPVTNLAMDGLVAAATLVYGAWASWRERGQR